MDARRTLQVLRRWLWLLVASVLFAGGASYLVSSALPKMYEATVTLIVGQSLQAVSPDYNQLLASQRLSQTYADLATTQLLLGRVIDRERLDTTPADLHHRVSADAPKDSTLITITVTDADPARVAAIANAVAAELIAASPAVNGQSSDIQTFVDKDLASTQTQIEATQAEVQRLTGLYFRTTDDENRLQLLQGRLSSLRQTYATLLQYSSKSGTNLLTVVDPATAPAVPSSPRVLVNTALAALVGVLLAIGLAFLVEYLDDTVKTREDVEANLGFATLGAIIRMRGDEKRQPMYRLAPILYPRSPAAEAYRTLRTNVEFASLDRPVRMLLVTSSIPGEGKTTTAANLAAVFAQAGHETILVDSDLRKPGTHKVFNMPNEKGLTTLLRSDEARVEDVAQATEQEHLRVITSGPLPPNPAELVRSERMKAILRRIATNAEYVIVDSPPLQAVTDAAILSSVVDGTVLVVDAGRTRRGAAQSGAEALRKVGGHVLGVILNRLSESMSGDYYYYNYYGGYGEQKQRRSGKHGRARQSAPGA